MTYAVWIHLCVRASMYTYCHRLSGVVDKGFHAEKLQILFTSKPLVQPRLTNNVPDTMTSFCIYSFTCSCGVAYIGRTSRHLSEQGPEHYPAWLNTEAIKTITIAVFTLDWVHPLSECNWTTQNSLQSLVQVIKTNEIPGLIYSYGCMHSSLQLPPCVAESSTCKHWNFVSTLVTETLSNPLRARGTGVKHIPLTHNSGPTPTTHTHQ